MPPIRPECGRRGRTLRAQRGMLNKSTSLISNLRNRSVHGTRPDEFVDRNLKHMFANFDVKGVIDTGARDSKRQGKILPSYLLRRSKVAELFCTEDLLFALTGHGACSAFSISTGEFICFLNSRQGEIIRSLYYHKPTKAMITVSVSSQDNFKALRCRHTHIEYIKRNQLEEGHDILVGERLSYPGFVEFDPVNGNILTFSAEKRVYKVWSLDDYHLKYGVCSNCVKDAKISFGTILFACKALIGEKRNMLLTKLLDIHTGDCIVSMTHEINPAVTVDLLEQLDEKLLIKQRDQNLRIFDAANPEGPEIVVRGTAKIAPESFIFLYELQMFVTFEKASIKVWNFEGKIISRMDQDLEDHVISTKHCYISSNQNLVISYSKSGRGTGLINISHLRTGRKICTIRGHGDHDDSDEDVRSQALADVTSLFYCDRDNVLYSGNHRGDVFVWSRRGLGWKCDRAGGPT